MEHHRILWRLRVAHPDPIADPARLAAGLRLHLAHAPLTSVLLQIGGQQQAYVALPGCAGCPTDRCSVGCRSTMLRRLLAETAPGLALQSVAGGLATRPYRRVLIAGPRGAATPLDGTLLALWPEARLQLSWRICRTQPIVAALLAVGGAGPDPVEVLRDQHWQAWPIPPKLRLRWAATPRPWALPLGQASAVPPSLLLPGASEDDSGTTALLQTTAPSALDGPLASWLSTVMEATLVAPTATEEGAAAEPEPPSPWPTGPNNLPPATLGTLIAQILAEPSFHSTRKGQSGISKGRLVGLKHPALTEPTARALMVWLDRAQLLAPPEDGQGPWRAPRLLASDDLDQIAGRLRTTPLPTPDETRAAYGGDG